jgi:hypothetical protein
LVVKESDDVRHFIWRKAESGHAFVRTAISDHWAEQISIDIMPQDGRSDQARSFGATVAGSAVAEGAGLFELLLAAVSRRRGLPGEDKAVQKKKWDDPL